MGGAPGGCGTDGGGRTVPAMSHPIWAPRDGFEWADAGIGAAVAIALMGMAGATFLLSTRARSRTV